MAKFSGKVGIRMKSENTKPGITKQIVKEFPIRGDLLSDVSRRNPGEKINDDITVTNRVSFIASAETRANRHNILYVVMDGIPWKVSSLENMRPKLILNLGGLWNGERPKP